MYHEIRNTLNATETSCATVQRNTIYEILRTKLSEKYAKQTQFPKKSNDVSFFYTMEYENKSDWTIGENKPNSNPNKANLKRAKMNVNSFITKDYRKNDDFAVRKNKPNSNPIFLRTKTNANLFTAKDYENETAFRPKKTNPIKPNFKNNECTLLCYMIL